MPASKARVSETITNSDIPETMELFLESEKPALQLLDYIIPVTYITKETNGWLSAGPVAHWMRRCCLSDPRV